MAHDEIALEEPGTAVSHACSGVAGENADIFFFLYIEAQGYVAGEFAWYVLLWSLLALGWCLVLV